MDYAEALYNPGQKRMKCGCLFHLTAYQPRLVYTVVQHCPNHARRVA